METRELLINGAKALDIELTELQVEQFYKYYQLLFEWNQKMNLTAIIDEREVIIKHFIDSIALVKVDHLHENLKVIDVGTGAGFPGIPLKIVYPNIELTLLDSLNKRVMFLEEVGKVIGLEGVECIHGRAEDYGKQIKYRENYDLCVSRAVANLSTLSEYCIPFVNIGGRFISYKSSQAKDEIKQSEPAITILGGQLVKKVNLEIPFSDITRTYVVIEKVKKTPNKFPRKAGKPLKNPISN